MSRLSVLPLLDSTTYRRHMLHDDARLWQEKNCYVDVVIEMLHALQLEPLAALGFCAAVDFEGDNFTFFKPSHDELRSLFGIDVQELNVWRPLLEHAKHHLGEGRFIATEADSINLPDTVATDYRRNHVKTTIIIAELDVEQQRLGYFHNASYHQLAGEDFVKLFGLDRERDPASLPFFAELIRVDRLVRRPPAELARMARALLQMHLARRPLDNPIDKFRQRVAVDMPWLQQQGVNVYHSWAFATIRQLGAAFELLALHVRWLGEVGDDDSLASAADDFMLVSGAAKTLVLKGARAVSGRKPLDAAALFEEMIQGWDRGMALLDRELGIPAETPA